MAKEEKKTETKEQKDAENNAMGPLQINAQYIKDFSFEAPTMPFLAAEMTEAPKIDIGININAAPVNKEQGVYTVELILKIDAKSAEKTAFICELTYGALVTLNVPEEHVQPMLLIEVPHLVFPYVRAIIANTTREAGMMPLTLSPIDFAALYRSRMMQEQAKEKKEKVN